ncbi:tlde1 domain-containing protein [Bradyrhizobium sp. LHD-71]|uniref:tlde1 domain-containing protein n=1 Tax=Bradyrhizobium sp. LHD-71 TaxID=3072141 RepID=UPI00281046A7|nr:tlde1 domain-containing protein [Bradyrhizobium sp. LHD-71]MDQ8730171.1 DUF2778 domain-containing protein [Bradyrhizobium sp. LHD-71]
MSSDTDALLGFAARDPRRPSPQAVSLKSGALPQNILGSVALAFVGTTCLWAVYSHVVSNEIANAATESPAKQVEVMAAPASTVIRESFAALQRGYSGLLDGRHLRLTPGTLSAGKPSTLADHLVALAKPVAPSPSTSDSLASISAAPKSQDRFPQSPDAVSQTAQNIPLPAQRPSKLASLQESAAPLSAQSTPKVAVEDKATVLALISSNKNSLFQRLFGKPKPAGTTLAYASPDGGVGADPRTILFDGMPKYDQWTAVYDISARTVYLPDGTELEAHSGLGKRMDDPRHVHVKMQGATPPHVYNLTMREALFHGVEALRLNPVGGDGRIFGRRGLLTHSYLLGPRGDSNGCISFKDYGTFVKAFKRGQIKRMVVVAKLA